MKQEHLTLELVDEATGAHNTAYLTITIIGNRSMANARFRSHPTQRELDAVTEAIPYFAASVLGEDIDPLGPPEYFATAESCATSNRKFLGGGVG